MKVELPDAVESDDDVLGELVCELATPEFIASELPSELGTSELLPDAPSVSA